MRLSNYPFFASVRGGCLGKLAGRSGVPRMLNCTARPPGAAAF